HRMGNIIAIISGAVVLATLARLAATDVKYYILPNTLNATLALACASFHLATGWTIISPQAALWGAAAGGGTLLAIRAAANRFYKDDAVGLGDVRLMAAGGSGLGFPNIMLAMSLGAGIGLVHGLLMGVAKRRRTGKPVDFGTVNVPAGLGLCAGIAIVMAIETRTLWTP